MLFGISNELPDSARKINARAPSIALTWQVERLEIDASHHGLVKEK